MNNPAGQQTTTVSTAVTTPAPLSTSLSISSSTATEAQPIDLSNVGTIDSYLALLEAKGASPYYDLAGELRKLPDLKNATAVAQITALALDSSNPETKEAFQLMIKGGTANPSDFAYPIPQYNTELQVLYWLASSRHLKYDDTLALAISLSNGLWVTIGDESVQSKVRVDVVGLLDYFRETDALQQAQGYSRLEQMPLEAKIALAWTGANTGTHGPHAITGAQVDVTHDSLHQEMTLAGYEWDAVSVATLRRMRDYVTQIGWVNPSVDKTVATVEDYFYFGGAADHFNYTGSWDTKIQINGEAVSARNNNNANFEFQHYLDTGKAIGVCEDDMTIINAFLKSWGIPTLSLETLWLEGNWYNGHDAVIYFEPVSGMWRMFRFHIGISFYLVNDGYIYIPPVIQNDFVPTEHEVPKTAVVTMSFKNGETNTKMMIPMYNITGSYLRQFEKGVSTAQVKQWILYKVQPPTVPVTYEKWNYEGPWLEAQGDAGGLLDQQHKAVGTFGQTYVDLAKLSYADSGGLMTFRFDFKGTVPEQVPAHVTSYWYQVALDTDANPNTGYHWASDLGAEYMLAVMIQYDSTTKTTGGWQVLYEHCGGSSDWCWARVGATQRFGITPVAAGGPGYNYIVLVLDNQDLGVTHGAVVKLVARTGIMYDDQIYNDYIPLSGTLRLSVDDQQSG